MRNRRLGLLIGCLATCVLALAHPLRPAQKELALPSERGRFDRIETAVTEGSIEILRAIRAELEEDIEEVEGAAGVADGYVLAFLDWRIAQLLDRGARKERKRLLTGAQMRLDLILKADPTHAEAHALRGTSIGDRIEGAFGGIVMGRRASASLDRAAELAPENPRVALQRGIGFFFTPKAFGGGMVRAEAELRRARQLFDNGDAAEVWPYWGRVDALAWLGQVLAETGRPEEARAVYKEALALAPGHAWIQGELLPALDE